MSKIINLANKISIFLFDMPLLVDPDHFVRWNKNGDHPNDDVWRRFEDTGNLPEIPREGKIVRYYRHPSVSGHSICASCKHTMHYHGVLDAGDHFEKVCPGDYIFSTIDSKQKYRYWRIAKNNIGKFFPTYEKII